MPARCLILASLVVTGLLEPSSGWSQPTPSVYVTFDDGEELTSSKRKELADSARDVREQLLKRPGIKRAEGRKDADVLVTILDRRMEVNPTGKNDWGGALSQTHYQSRHIVFFRFESVHTSEESEIALAGAFVTWKRVAGVLAKDAEEWAIQNR